MRVGGMWAIWIASQIGPIGRRRIDRAGPAPGDRLASRGDDDAHAVGHGIVGIGVDEFPISVERVALQS